MKTFKKYMSEKVELPSGGDLNINRKEMPQIDGKHMKGFFAYLENQDISVTREKIDPDTLKPTQNQFHKSKIQGMMDAIEDGSYKPKDVVVSKDNHVVDGHHTWLACKNLECDMYIQRVDVPAKHLIALMHEYPKSYTKKLYEETESYDFVISEATGEACAIISKEHMKAFEEFVDRMFKKFGIDFNFTNHFRDRMSDARNKPCIDIKELAGFIKKIYAKQGKSLKTVAGAEAVLKDLQTDLNIPVAVKYDAKNDEFDVAMKTIMRKKSFRSPDKSISY